MHYGNKSTPPQSLHLSSPSSASQTMAGKADTSHAPGSDQDQQGQKHASHAGLATHKLFRWAKKTYLFRLANKLYQLGLDILSSIRAKFILSFFLIFLIIFTLTAYVFTKAQVDTMVSQKEDSFKVLANSLSSTYNSLLLTIDLIREDKITLHEQLNDLFASDIEDLHGLFIIDRTDRFIFGKFSSNGLQDHFLYQEDQTAPAQIMDKFPEDRSFFKETIILEEQPFHILYKRIYFTSLKGEFLSGYIGITYSLEGVYSDAYSTLLTSGAITLVAASVSLVFIFLLSSLFTKRILIIYKAVKRISEGKFTKIKPVGRDEVSLLMREVNHMIDSMRQRLLLSKYVSDTTLQEITSTNVQMKSDHEEVTLFFSDIRSFMEFTEDQPKDVVVSSLNSLLALQVDIIRKFGGDIDKFVGDQIMAVFKGQNMEKRAFLAAQKIQSKIRTSNIGLTVGIGLHKGEALFGNIGSSDRMDSTFIGETVNIASRLCAKADEFEVIVTRDIQQKISFIPLLGPFEIMVKGKKDPITVYKKTYNA